MSAVCEFVAFRSCFFAGREKSATGGGLLAADAMAMAVGAILVGKPLPVGEEDGNALKALKDLDLNLPWVSEREREILEEAWNILFQACL